MKKTILITGSTNGIGKLAALRMANEGHALYIHGRNKEKVESSIAEIIAKTKNLNVSGFVADLSELDEVKRLSAAVSKDLSHIDVLINNAGVYNSSESMNSAGLDMRFVVNYLAPYLLTDLLLPLLEGSSNPRIINLSSAAQSSVSIDALVGNERRSESDTYAQSKLAITMWSFYLAKQKPNISVLALNPGSLLNTRMVREAFGQSWSSPDKGASIIFDLAVSDFYEKMSGLYFDNDRGNFGKAHKDAYDHDLIKELINQTELLLGKHE